MPITHIVPHASHQQPLEHPSRPATSHPNCTRRDVPLNGYGSEPGEAEWPAYTRFAVADVGPQGRFFYLTYAGGMVHAWDSEGMRAGGAILEGAGEDEMSCHSFRCVRLCLVLWWWLAREWFIPNRDAGARGIHAFWVEGRVGHALCVQ